MPVSVPPIPLWPGPSRRLLRALIRRWAATISVGQDPFATLERELTYSRAAPSRFWWRDDDAVKDTPGLRRLMVLRERLGVPLALAVIPAYLQPSLIEQVKGGREMRVLVHGWAHRNHAATGSPPSEYPPTRSVAEVRAELAEAWARLSDAFGADALPVLVPPFNVIARGLGPAVAGTGLVRLSIDRDFADFPMRNCNVHVDVIDWQRRTAVTPEQAVRPLLAALRLRRWGLVPNAEPIGVMTHHLAHDEAVWALTARLMQVLAAHSAVAFPPLDVLFRQGG